MGTVTNRLIQNIGNPNILDQAVGYCSYYFGSGCWLLFPIFWIRRLVTVPIILNRAVGYSSYFLDQALGTVTNNLIQNNRSRNQQPGPK
jgi:hypothetical protein